MNARVLELARVAREAHEAILAIPQTRDIVGALRLLTQMAEALADAPYETLHAFHMETRGHEQSVMDHLVNALAIQLRRSPWWVYPVFFPPCNECPFEGGRVSAEHCMTWNLRQPDGSSDWACAHISACRACPHNPFTPPLKETSRV